MRDRGSSGTSRQQQRNLKALRHFFTPAQMGLHASGPAPVPVTVTPDGLAHVDADVLVTVLHGLVLGKGLPASIEEAAKAYHARTAATQRKVSASRPTKLLAFPPRL